MFSFDSNREEFERELKRTDQNGQRLAMNLAVVLKSKLNFVDQFIEGQLQNRDPDDANASFIERTIGRECAKRYRLVRLVRELEHLGDVFPMSDAQTTSWHDVAEDMMQCFQQVMKKTKRERQYGMSNPGPATRFVKSALREVFGRDIEIDAIVQALRRRGYGGASDGTNRDT